MSWFDWFGAAPTASDPISNFLKQFYATETEGSPAVPITPQNTITRPPRTFRTRPLDAMPEMPMSDAMRYFQGGDMNSGVVNELRPNPMAPGLLDVTNRTVPPPAPPPTPGAPVGAPDPESDLMPGTHYGMRVDDPSFKQPAMAPSVNASQPSLWERIFGKSEEDPMNLDINRRINFSKNALPWQVLANIGAGMINRPKYQGLMGALGEGAKQGLKTAQDFPMKQLQQALGETQLGNLNYQLQQRMRLMKMMDDPKLSQMANAQLTYQMMNPTSTRTPEFANQSHLVVTRNGRLVTEPNEVYGPGKETAAKAETTGREAALPTAKATGEADLAKLAEHPDPTIAAVAKTALLKRDYGKAWEYRPGQGPILADEKYQTRYQELKNARDTIDQLENFIKKNPKAIYDPQQRLEIQNLVKRSIFAEKYIYQGDQALRGFESKDMFEKFLKDPTTLGAFVETVGNPVEALRRGLHYARESTYRGMEDLRAAHGLKSETSVPRGSQEEADIRDAATRGYRRGVAMPMSPQENTYPPPPNGWRDTGRKTPDGRPIYTDGMRTISPKAQ